MRGPSLFIAVLLTFCPVAALAEGDADSVAKARSCIEARGVAACTTVLGHCDPVSGFERRRGCAEAIAASWELVLQSYLSEMQVAADAFDAANNRDNDPPLADLITREQEAWANFRAASCAIELGGERIVTGPEEGAAYCKTGMTLQRLTEIEARTRFFADYVGEK